ncbi:EAL domain-containing protein [Caballeronia grimmiae]|uniref:EAL domain-containing protein n=1 Tax=Caballeronia grimmiae TaxID=1071679 RepID=UPI0038B8871A
MIFATRFLMLPKSLFARIFLIYATTMILSVMTGLGLFYRFQFLQHIEETQDAAQMLVDVAAQSVEESAVIGDYDTIKRTLVKTISGTTFNTAKYIDVGGGVIRLNDRERLERSSPQWLNKIIATRMYDVNRVISAGGQNYGVMRLSFDTQYIADDIWKLVESSAALATAFLLAGLVILRQLVRRWVGNLGYLQTYQQQVLSGEITAQATMPLHAPIEIREAIEAVNQSAESLRRQFGERIDVLIDSLFQHKSAMDRAAIVCETDRDGVVTYVNDLFVQHSQVRREEVIGQRLQSYFPESGCEAAWDRPWVSEDGVWHGEVMARSATRGTDQWRRRTIVPIFDKTGEVEKFICIDIDITHQKQSERAASAHARRQGLIAEFGRHALHAQDAEQLWKKALEVVGQGLTPQLQSVARTDSSGDIGRHTLYSLDSEITSTSNHAPTEVKSSQLDSLFDDKPVVVSDVEQLLGVGQSYLTTAHGIRSALTVPVASFQKTHGYLGAYWQTPRSIGPEETDFLRSIANALATACDREAANVKLTYLARFDALTDLPNRGHFMAGLGEALNAAHEQQEDLAVMFVDLDRFKLVNDTLGHGAGDLLLMQAALRLRESVRSTDIVARLGGDEFAIVLPRPLSRDSIEQIARRAVAALSQPFLLSGQQVFVSASIGIAFSPVDASEPGHLLQCADAAMYAAKQSGRNAYRFYTAEMHARVLERLEVESRLHKALARHEFELHYQPKVSVKSGELRGFEALLRWDCPQKGLVSPADFIPILEDTGLIIPVGEWVVREVCAQLCRWKEQGFEMQPIAINLSARQFEQADLANRIAGIIHEYDVDASYLEFELTESMLMADPEAASATLQEMKAIGLRLSIDDFGTGYSSLAYLKRFPLDCLKIDRTFINDLPHDLDDVAITKAIITLAHNLELTVIAEGVERNDQLELLRASRCDEFQGFLFSRPLQSIDCEKHLTLGGSSTLNGWATERNGLLL